VRIVVEDLPDSGRRFSGKADIDLAEFAGPERLELVEPLDYDLQATKLGSTATLRGNIAARVRVECSRCAENFEISMAREFEAVFVTADTGETDRAVELDEDDLDLDYYQDGAIDGTAFLAEQIFLELPMKVLCAEDCAGLCAQCGANLNHETCDCEPEVDPRLASLKALRDRL